MSRNISICRDLFLDIAMQFSYNITTRKEEKNTGQRYLTQE